MPPARRTVLVTGAGGSIGSELCRQLTGCDLVLFEQSEYALYKIHAELGGTPILGSCADEGLVAHVFAKYRPDLVVHAAAYKHVPLLEGENAFVGARNNILGTLHTATYAPADYLLISTDKAVNPSCAMGAAKRVCELVAAELGGSIVRFGNVLDSAGSVMPRFREQIMEGKNVTVTDARVERYFISIHDAVRLVLRASVLCESGVIYMLEMGAPRRILDLAKEMIAASGKEIPISFIGLRPGEKLTEEIQYRHERKVATSDPSLYALHSEMARVIHRLGWLGRTHASYEATQSWLASVLSERDSHLSKCKLSVV